MRKEQIYIDLSKCTEDERKHAISLLPTDKITAQIYYMVRNSDWEVLKAFSHLFFNEYSIWRLCSNRSTEIFGKTELTYPEFIKLFKGGEGEKLIDLNISKEDFIFSCDASRQNLNSRENEQEIFLAGIESVIEELNIKFNSK